MRRIDTSGPASRATRRRQVPIHREEPEEALSHEELDALRVRMEEFSANDPANAEESGATAQVMPHDDPTASGRNSVFGWRIAIVLGLLPLVATSLYAMWPTPYVYSNSQGTFWRLNRATGVRETSTANGWKTDSELEATRKLALPDLKVSAETGQLSCQAKFEPNGDPSLASRVPVLSTSLKLHFDQPLPRPRESTANRTITVRLLDRDGVTVLEDAIPLAKFKASQDARTFVAERLLKARKEDFQRITSWTAKANWQTVRFNVDGHNVAVTWGAAYSPSASDIEDLKQAYRDQHSN